MTKANQQSSSQRYRWLVADIVDCEVYVQAQKGRKPIVILKVLFKFILSIFGSARRSILLIGCIFFLTTNLLTLTSSLVQSALSASLGMLGFSSVYSLLDSSIQKQRTNNKKLDAELVEASKGKTQLLDKNTRLQKELEGERGKSKKLGDDLGAEKAKSKLLASDRDRYRSKVAGLESNNRQLKAGKAKVEKTLLNQRTAVKALGGRVTKRTLKTASVNVGSIPFESVPWVGAGVVAVVTVIELHMTCDNIKDMNEIYAAMGISPEEDPGIVENTCLGYIDNVESIVDETSSSVDMANVNIWVQEILAKAGIGDEQ